MKRRRHGYTLIEILIVLFIISIVSGVALLSISRNQNNQIDAFVRELTETLTLAEEQAMLQPAVLGLTFGEHSFRFASFATAIEDEQKSDWVPLDDNILGTHNIPRTIQLDVKVIGQQKSAPDDKDKSLPQIIISTNGTITPFSIYVGQRGQKPRYLIQGDADGNVTNKLLS